MDEPKLTGALLVGRALFRAGVKLSTAQGSIDRLYARYEKMEEVLYDVKRLDARLPEELRNRVSAALGLAGASSCGASRKPAP